MKRAKRPVQTEPSADMFRQTKPCSDCPFRKENGIRHGTSHVLAYLSYFVNEPSATFPCHETRHDGQNNDEWAPWREGQTICAGGLILAEKLGTRNRLLQYAIDKGWYKPSKLQERETIVDDVDELVRLNE